MTTTDATAEVFYTAFKALPNKERESVIKRMMDDRFFREDIGDILVAMQREKEQSEPYDRVRKSLKESGKL